MVKSSSVCSHMNLPSSFLETKMDINEHIIKTIDASAFKIVYQKGDNSNFKKKIANKKPNSENTRICRNINKIIFL